MFGGNKPSGGGLFGTPTSTTTGTTGTTGSGLFNLSTPANSTPQSGGSLFNTPTTTAGTGTGLFGGAATMTTTSAPAGPSLFGTTPAASTAPAAGGLGLFGKPATPATTTTSAPSGLFGAAPAAAATNTTSAPSLFSNTATATNTTPSLFGSSPAPASTAGATGTTGGLFNTTAPKPSLFTTTPSATAATTNTLFPTGSIGGLATTTSTTQPNQQQQQQGQTGLQSAVKVELYNLAPYHKFHELNDALKAEVESAEKYILSEIQKCEALSALFPEHREMVQSVRTDAELMERRLMTANSFLQSDSATLESLINHQKQDDQHASLSVRTLDLLRQPNASRLIQAQQQASAAGGAATPGPGMNLNLSINPLSAVPGQPSTETFGPLPTLSSTSTSELDITSNAGMISYFNRHGAEMEARLKQFLESVSEVEASLRSVEIQVARKSASRGLTGLDGAVSGSGGGGRSGMTDDGKNNAESRQDEARRLNRALREFYAAMSDTAGRLVDAKEGLRAVKVAVQKEGLVPGMGGMRGSVMRR